MLNRIRKVPFIDLSSSKDGQGIDISWIYDTWNTIRKVSTYIMWSVTYQ